jgi:hypothetical protein
VHTTLFLCVRIISEAGCLLAAGPSHVTPLALATAVSVFERLWYMDDKISWLSGWASQWRPPQGLSEHKHCDNTATNLNSENARSRKVASLWGSVGTGEKSKMSQVLGTFRLLDFTMLQPVLTWRTFLNL